MSLNGEYMLWIKIPLVTWGFTCVSYCQIVTVPYTIKVKI